MKKVLPIISLSIIGVLIITTIVMFFTPISHSFKIEKPEDIRLYDNSSFYDPDYTVSDNVTNKEYYDEVRNKLTNAFKDTALEALFNGRLGKNAELVQRSSTLNLSEGVYVVYSYGENTKTVKDGDTRVSYKYIAFELSDVDDYVTVRAYLIENDDDIDEDGVITYSYYFNMIGNTSNLYNYVVNDLQPAY